MNEEVLYAGRFVSLVRDQASGWEYVTRQSVSGIVIIIATTTEHELILVEQYRPPLESKVLELPAGLAGDTEAFAGESLLTASRRELLEETGYESDDWEWLCEAAPSAGITSERHQFLRARACRRVADGGGDESEDIRTILISTDRALEYAKDYASAEDCAVSSTVFAGLALL